MSTNSQITTYLSNINTTNRRLGELSDALNDFADAMEIAGLLVESVDFTGDIAGYIRQQSEDALRVLQLTKQAGPLTTPSRLLETVLKKVKPVAEKIENAVDRLNGKQDTRDDEPEQDGEFLNALSSALNDAADVLQASVAQIEATRAQLDDVSKSFATFVVAMDVATRGASGTFAFPEDQAASVEMKADMDPLNAAVGAELAPRNAFVAELVNDYNVVRDQIDAVLKLMSAARMDIALEGDVDLSGIEGFLDVIDGPLSAAAAALKPVQGILDAVGAVVDLILTPVFDFLTAVLGIDALMDEISDAITDALPGADLLEPFIEQAQAMLDDIRDFIADNFGVNDLVDQYGFALLDGVESALFGSVLGDTQRSTVGLGTDGDDTITGSSTAGGAGDLIDARAGDDVVTGGAGNDLILASEGDDTVSGGAGNDMLFFDGLFNEFELARDGENGPIIITHVAPRAGSVSLGSETLTDFEWVAFRNITFRGSDLEDAQFGPSVLNGTDEDDLLFLNSSGPIFPGDFHRANGLAGNDRIFGSTANDLLNGGFGNDVFIPGLGNDSIEGDDRNESTVNGQDGSDSYQILAGDGSSSQNVTVNLQTGRTGMSLEGNDSLVGVENAIIQFTGDHSIIGNEEHNRLITTEGRDTLEGYGGDDYLEAGDGKDVLIGGAGRDTLLGAADNDVLIAAGAPVPEGETYDGGSGLDALSYSTEPGVISDLVSGDPQVLNGLTPVLTRNDYSGGPVRAFGSTGVIQHLDGSGAVIGTDLALNIEKLAGTDGNDTIFGSVIDGFGQSMIHGAGGDDDLYAAGSGQVFGGAGNDLIRASLVKGLSRSETYTYSGGDGEDTVDTALVGAARWDINILSVKQDLRAFSVDADGYADADRLYKVSGTGLEQFLLGDNADRVYARPDGDLRLTFQMGAGNDSVDAEGGVIIVNAGAGNDIAEFDSYGEFYGGLGDDTVDFDGGTNIPGVLDMGQGNDLIQVGSFRGRIDGGAGYDTALFQGVGGVTVSLGSETATQRSGTSLDAVMTGIERLIGSTSSDILLGGANNDVIVGRDGNDSLNGASGDDSLFGGNGADTIGGGAGDDTIHGGSGADVLDGGLGRNALSYGNATPNTGDGTLAAMDFGNVTVNLTAGRATGAHGTDTISNFQDVFASRFNDTLIGDMQNNLLSGDLGNDRLEGMEGDDILLTGEGDDTALGGDGDDTIVFDLGTDEIDGGAGNDSIDLGFLGGSVSINMGTGQITSEYQTQAVVWRDTETEETRDFGSNSYRPEDVLRTDPLYSITVADTNRNLPSREDPLAPSFGVIEDLQTRTGGATFTAIEGVVGGLAETRLTLSNAVETFDGARGDNDKLFIGLQDEDVLFNLTTGQTNEVTAQGDTLIGIDHLASGGGDDMLIGNDRNNELFSRGGQDRLEGLGGNDTLEAIGGNAAMFGGAGDDHYILWLDFGTTATVVEAAGEGTDLVEVYGAFTLGQNLENLTLKSVNTTGTGNALRNVITGTVGSDTLNGLAGDDTLLADDGADVVNGGDGRDMISYMSNENSSNTSTAGVQVDLAAGRANDRSGQTDRLSGIEDAEGSLYNDSLLGSDAANLLNGMDGDDSLTGGRGNDLLSGGNGDDSLGGGADSDTLFGGDGDDRLFGDDANDILYGGADDDTLEGGAGDDFVGSGTGNDQVLGQAGADSLYGADGDDTLSGGAGDDVLGGGTGDDSLFGGSEADALWGALGDDTLDGGWGNDTLGAADGDDLLFGNNGNDELWTAAGNDTASGGLGNDTLGGADGDDSLSGDEGSDEIWGARGTDTLLGGAGNDQLGGGAGNDSLEGGAGADSLFGGWGNDLIFGGDDDDLIFGASGDDTLSGGLGNDTVYAGTGADIVIVEAGADELHFFSDTEDRLALDDDMWGGGLTVSQVVSTYGRTVGGDYVLDFGGGNSVTLVGQAGISNLEAQLDIF